VLALIAAILIGLHAIGVSDPGQLSLFYLGLAFWAAHFAWSYTPWRCSDR
jgi:hypothetical protein